MIIVMGADVRVSTVAVAQSNLTVGEAHATRTHPRRDAVESDHRAGPGVDGRHPACELPGLVLGDAQEVGKVDYILNNSFGMLGINSVVVIGRV